MANELRAWLAGGPMHDQIEYIEKPSDRLFIEVSYTDEEGKKKTMDFEYAKGVKINGFEWIYMFVPPQSSIPTKYRRTGRVKVS